MTESTLGLIRSYVTRTTRMSPAQKRAWERYGDTYCIPYDENRVLKFDALFPDRGDDRTTILDIGFGMGRELAELASRTPHVDYLGVEVHKPGVGRLLLDIVERELKNVRIIAYDAVAVCRSMIPNESLDGVHLFFPDPWPKKRHHKRRLVRPGDPEMVAPLMKRGAGFYAVTDWTDYADQIVEVMTRSNPFQNRWSRFAPPQAWRPKTAFEEKGLRKGHTIREIVFERR